MDVFKHLKIPDCALIKMIVEQLIKDFGELQRKLVLQDMARKPKTVTTTSV